MDFSRRSDKPLKIVCCICRDGLCRRKEHSESQREVDWKFRVPKRSDDKGWKKVGKYGNYGIGKFLWENPESELYSWRDNWRRLVLREDRSEWKPKMVIGEENVVEKRNDGWFPGMACWRGEWDCGRL